MTTVTLWYRKDKGEGGILKMLFDCATQCVWGNGTPLPKKWVVGSRLASFLTFVSPYPIHELLYRKPLHCVVQYNNITIWQRIVVIRSGGFPIR